MVDDTKLAIANAFKALIQEKSISKINVQDISSLAGVSRHTFYYHFHDKYHLIAWIFMQMYETKKNKLILSMEKI